MSQLRVDELVDEEGTGSPDFPFGFTIGRVQYSISDNFPFTDSGRLTFGADSDLQIYHDGSHSYVKDAGTGNLKIQGDNMQLLTSDGASTYLEGASFSCLHSLASTHPTYFSSSISYLIF